MQFPVLEGVTHFEVRQLIIAGLSSNIVRLKGVYSHSEADGNCNANEVLRGTGKNRPLKNLDEHPKTA